MKILFIGGPIDGEWKDAAIPPPPFFRVAKMAGFDVVSREPSPLSRTYETTDYRIELWRSGPNDLHYLYVHKKLTTKEAFIRLLKHYRPI